jgi:hypothetical protein
LGGQLFHIQFQPSHHFHAAPIVFICQVGQHGATIAAASEQRVGARPYLAGGSHVKRPSFGAICLALIPFVAMCFSVSAWDRVYPMVFGLPFNLFWLLLWIMLTSMCLWGVYRLETPRIAKVAGRRHGESRPE